VPILETSVTDDEIRCQQDGCKRTHKNHKWGKIRAYREGWYAMKDDRSWCPEHRPPWAPEVTPS
jgi:hypothetical protein